ncbi:hypothetical protein BPAE_0035g00240 [Botrytis paeoniae]|uniref:Uncharacterized protein n=1 Tax=Botrytis paeoniae TaxID=278948 RepID=A0A4Z1G1L3_9HELO|nr:hypothetical protein BPAE_0035g00240 [Botrytis paeoniae]
MNKSATSQVETSNQSSTPSEAKIPGAAFNNYEGGWQEPIAVVGLAFKLPGDINHKHGHFLKGDIGAFDAPFFSMPSEEAACMDPMQRWLLEVTYEALKNVGMSLQEVNGSYTSVHIGSFTADYNTILNKDPQRHQKYMATGVAQSILADRISWFYNFKGPSVVLDTACSSSLSALHIACQAIHSGESKMLCCLPVQKMLKNLKSSLCQGIVGGCNLMATPELFMALADLNFTSQDGVCYSFDHRANGYSRGEGFSIVIIKKLSHALNDGDTIRAIIRSTSANQDGRMPGITQPNMLAQESMIRRAYSIAVLDMSQTAFVEAHGTGTPMGDPVEASAIGSAFDTPRAHGGPLYIGALKSNIGHLEGASGIAALIKTILTLEKGIIPPNIWFEKLNPKINAEKFNLQFPVKPTLWPIDGLRRASVNSFGVGGANVHAILDDAYNYLRLNNLSGRVNTKYSTSCLQDLGNVDLQHISNGLNDLNTVPRLNLLIFSAAEQNGLEIIAIAYQRYHEKLDSVACSYLQDLAYTLFRKRTHLPWKSFCVVNSLEDLQTNLHDKFSLPTQSVRKPKVCYVFNGQGAQWWRMGRELLIYQIFAQSLQESEEAFRGFGCSWSLIEELSKEERHSKLNDTAFSQPVCTAVQIALVQLLASWRVVPSAVIGHSSGEITAAYCIGALSHDSACKVAYFRGLVAASLCNDSKQSGAMMAIGCSESEVTRYISTAKFEDAVTIACYNSPQSFTVSGDEPSILKLETVLKQDKVFARKLQLQTLHVGSALADSLVMFSSTTGKRISADEVLKADHWVQNMVSPVRFSEAAQNMIGQHQLQRAKLMRPVKHEEEINFILEIGPHCTLQGPLKDLINTISGSRKISYSSVLIRNRSALHTAIDAAGKMYCAGINLDIDMVNNPGSVLEKHRMLVDLPPYPFNHTKKYWSESRLSKNFRSHSPWVLDHKVNDDCLYPATGMLVMAIEAACQTSSIDRKYVAFRFRDVQILRALRIPLTDEGIDVEFYLRPAREITGKFLVWNSFRLCALDNDEWIEICHGEIAIEYKDQVDEHNFEERNLEQSNRFEKGLSRCKTFLDVNRIYRHLSICGVTYGPSFQALRNIHFDGNDAATATMNLCHWATSQSFQSTQDHIIHPAALDSVLQISFIPITNGGEKVVPILVPTIFRELWISAGIRNSGHSAKAQDISNAISIFTHAKLHGSKGETSIVAVITESKELHIFGEFVGSSAGLSTMPSENLVTSIGLCYNVVWKPDVNLLTQTRPSSEVDKTFVPPVPNFLSVEKKVLIQLSLSRLLRSPQDQKTLVGSPNLKKYLDWAQHYLDTNENQLDLSLYDESIFHTLCDQIESNDPEGELLVRVVKNLKCVFEGKMQALEVLFRDNLTTSYYQFANQMTPAFSQGMVYLDFWHIINRTLRSLRLELDISGKRFNEPRFTDYTFTDISPKFFCACSREIPREQGFGSSEYDLIIASNVLHATASLTDVLHNIHTMLKPDGRLVLCEASPTNIESAFMFGLLPGWWLGLISLLPRCEFPKANVPEATEEFRSRGPLMTRESWNTILLQCGFSGIDLAFPAVEDDVGNFMVSRVCMVPTEVNNTPKKIIILHNDDRIQVEIANHLERSYESSIQQECSSISVREAQLHIGLFEDALCVSLLDIQNSFLDRISDENYALLQTICLSATTTIWISYGSITENPYSSMMSGLLRTLRYEQPQKKFVKLDISEVCEVSRTAQIIREILDQTVKASPESYEPERQPAQQEVLNRHPLRKIKPIFASPGVLSSFEFVDENSSAFEMGPDEVEVKVKASGMNFLDILIGLGQAASDDLGCECSGIVTRLGSKAAAHFQIGDRVSCMCQGTMGMYARSKTYLSVTKIPDSMTFSTAAGFAVTHLTAYHSIMNLARMKYGESILVHSGAGGFGQACIQIARMLNADIFTTVSTEEKKKFLIETYGIREDHIFSSRTPGFLDGIKRITSNRGVDVIINTLTNEALRCSWECVARSGRFIEAGKRDINNLGTLPMFQFSKSVSFISVDLVGIYLYEPPVIAELYQAIMPLLESGKLHVSAPMQVYGISDFEQLRMSLEMCKYMPPIRGCIQGSMVLFDSTFANMTLAAFNAAVKPKVDGTWNLHKALPNGMVFFIMLASISGVMGLHGQANYACGNTYQDEFARYRCQLGEKAVSLDLGIVSNVGWVAEQKMTPSASNTLEDLPAIRVSESELYAVLDYYCDPSLPVQTGFHSQTWIGQVQMKQKRLGLADPHWMQLPIARSLRQRGTHNVSNNTDEGSVDYKSLIKEADSQAKVTDIIISGLQSKLSRTLAMEKEDIDAERPMHTYGVDSLSAVEVRLWFKKSIGADISVFEIMGNESMSTLAAKLAGRVKSWETNDAEPEKKPK